MRFLFFTKGGKDVPSSRYRAYYLAEALQELGHAASVTQTTDYSFGAFLRYFRALMSAGRGDVIFLQRTIYNKYFLAAVLLARLLGKRYVFDIDDAVFEHSPLKTGLLARFAAAVTCGSELIRSWAQLRNRNTFILENGLPLSIYNRREAEPEGIPVIGWIGSGPAHHENLKILPPILHALHEKGIAYTFRLIGALKDPLLYELFDGMKNVEIIDTLNWSDPSEAVREIRKFTIGVMPLTMDAWNQAKHFKALEYMACGVSVVASPGQALKPIFAEAGCGFFARTEDEWAQCISRLLGEPSLRKREGEKGRRVVEQNYSSESMAKKLLALIAK